MKYLDWIGVPLMLFGAAMLLTDIGASGLWIAAVSVGVAFVAVELYWRRTHPVT